MLALFYNRPFHFSHFFTFLYTLNPLIFSLSTFLSFFSRLFTVLCSACKLTITGTLSGLLSGLLSRHTCFYAVKWRVCLSGYPDHRTLIKDAESSPARRCPQIPLGKVKGVFFKILEKDALDHLLGRLS